jgi:hypothetical protein
VTIRRGREPLDSVHISDLPTCLVDLVRRSSTSQSSHFGELDLANLTVSLELLYMTFHNESTIPYKSEASHRSVSISST